MNLEVYNKLPELKEDNLMEYYAEASENETGMELVHKDLFNWDDIEIKIQDRGVVTIEFINMELFMEGSIGNVTIGLSENKWNFFY